MVVPVYNDATALAALLPQLLDAALEVVVVDGNSTDGSAQVAAKAGARVIACRPNRGAQMRIGSEVSKGDLIWFLHSDSELNVAALVEQMCALTQPAWGRFDIAFQEQTTSLAIIAANMNRRSRITGICTGDQGVFVHRDLLTAIGGMPGQPLMEDVELSRRLKRLQPPVSLPGPLRTSGRRWLQRGVIRTTLHMWWLRGRYFFGADPTILARHYYASSP